MCEIWLTVNNYPYSRLGRYTNRGFCKKFPLAIFVRKVKKIRHVDFANRTESSQLRVVISVDSDIYISISKFTVEGNA